MVQWFSGWRDSFSSGVPSETSPESHLQGPRVRFGRNMILLGASNQVKGGDPSIHRSEVSPLKEGIHYYWRRGWVYSSGVNIVPFVLVESLPTLFNQPLLILVVAVASGH